MKNRLGRLEHNDFSSKLIALGFKQIGDCTYFGDVVKIFRTSKSSKVKTRYWEIQDSRTGFAFFRSNHCNDIIDYLSHSKLLLNGAIMKITVEVKNG